MRPVYLLISFLDVLDLTLASEAVLYVRRWVGALSQAAVAPEQQFEASLGSYERYQLYNAQSLAFD